MKVKIESKQELALYILQIPNIVRGIFRKRSFKDIRIMLLTIGFPRSGSSLLGFLLTAHPNIVIACEPRISRRFGVHPTIKISDIRYPNVDILYEADDLNKVFNYILAVDYQRLQNKNRGRSDYLWSRANRYVVVPNQHQGCFKKLEVIGTKCSGLNTEILSDNNLLSNLKNKLEKRKIALKLIFTVRNPYDMIATNSRMTKANLWENIRSYTKLFDNNMRILQQIQSKDIFICRHEDTVKDPSRQLAKLCDFLQVPIPPSYLDDCASQVVQKLHKSRLIIDWSEEQKQKVASLIETYDFLSGYSWES